VHCVHVSESDVGIIKRSGAHIALCPRSNDLLDVGRAPVALFNKLGIPLALGTDSLASNNSLSLWDELRFALETFPDDLAEQDVFSMVTTGGAAALGITATSGSLCAGKRADFQVVGEFGSSNKMILERIIRDGRVHEVFVSGKRYRGNTTAGN
jgi:cytosine/adenosine deaminase-related metal-dependent hydrolase